MPGRLGEWSLRVRDVILRNGGIFVSACMVSECKKFAEGSGAFSRQVRSFGGLWGVLGDFWRARCGRRYFFFE